ncbi:MAG: Crp/Fnr family transcriptional regulator [Xanthobacteraceae bacterium]
MNETMTTPRKTFNRQHPFIVRLSQHVELSPTDLESLDAIIDGEFVIRRRHDHVIDGYKSRKLSFVKDGFAVRYKLLRNGKRQILNVVLPGDIIGMPGSFFERASYSVMAVSELRLNVCALDAYVQLCYQRPQFGLALSWIAVQEAAVYAEHIIDVGRRTPIERLSQFLLELHARLLAVGRAEVARFTLPFSQEVMADVLGLSVPHLNRMMQRLRAEKLITDRERLVEFLDAPAMQTLAHYQPQSLTPIPFAGRDNGDAARLGADGEMIGDLRRDGR